MDCYLITSGVPVMRGWGLRILNRFACLDMNPVKATHSQVVKIQLIDLLNRVTFPQDSRKFHIGIFLLNHTESTTEKKYSVNQGIQLLVMDSTG